MKKVILSVAAIAFVLSLASCASETTCKTTMNGTLVGEQKYDKLRRSERKDIEREGTYSVGNNKFETTCD